MRVVVCIIWHSDFYVLFSIVIKFIKFNPTNPDTFDVADGGGRPAPAAQDP